MVRTSKSSTTSSNTTSSAKAVVAPATVVAAAPVENTVVVEQTAATKKAKKSKAAVATESAAATTTTTTTTTTAPTTSTPVTESAATVEVGESSLTVKMSEFSAKLQQLASLFSSAKSDFKVLEKAMQKELKAAQKSSAKKTKRSGNRQPSGFVKPTRISDELAQFLGKEIGAEMARTSVSKEINQYIRTNSLQDKVNGRKINPDAKLTTLLKVPAGDELTYFNLQKYMKHHFVKAAVSAEGAVATA